MHYIEYNIDSSACCDKQENMDLMEYVRRPRVEGVKLQAVGSQEEPIVGGTLVVTAFFFIFSTRKSAGQDELIVREIYLK